MLSYRPAFYCDICIVSLKYFFFIYGTLNLTFLHYITLRYITLHSVGQLAGRMERQAADGKTDRQAAMRNATVYGGTSVYEETCCEASW